MDDEDQTGADGGARQRGAEPHLEVYGRGVRTALRNNATAYGFSIAMTSAYGLVNSASDNATAAETISFALGAAFAFIVIGGVFIAQFPQGRLSEGGQEVTFSGGIDVISVVVTVAAAYGLSRIPGFAAWPSTAFGSVIVYLLTSGLDVLLARVVAKRTSFGRSQ